MPVYEVPSYIKPKSRIASGILPMAYVTEEKSEYISDLKNAIPVVREQIKMYNKYQTLVMRKDLRGNPEAFKVLPDVSSIVLVPVEEFVNEATGDNELFKFNGKFNLLTNEGLKLVEAVYNALDRDMRVQIAVPMQWLVWIPKKKILSRMCWVVALEGNIIVRPYGTTNILLEVQDAKFDKINSVSIRELKKHATIKERLNNHWRSIIVSEEMAELGEEFGLEEYTEERTEEESGEVGEVE